MSHGGYGYSSLFSHWLGPDIQIGLEQGLLMFISLRFVQAVSQRNFLVHHLYVLSCVDNTLVVCFTCCSS